MTRALMLAGTSSGSGKTLITAGMATALRRQGLRVATLKCGPDYIDPCFHEKATGRACFNLDPWSMSFGLINHLIGKAKEASDILLIEGVMGLFDDSQTPGVHPSCSSAALAKMLDVSVVLIVGAAGTSQSLAATAYGFAHYDPALDFVGVIANRVASVRHETLIRKGFDRPDTPQLLGCLGRESKAVLPSRHLGLVQAQELDNLDTTLSLMADRLEAALDFDHLLTFARPLGNTLPDKVFPLPPLGQTMAIASDAAFAFAYPHILDGWQAQGARLTFFSPLANESPDPDADAIYLPGGYPELHLPQLSSQKDWQEAIRKAAARGVSVYGECGGYMTLGRSIVDSEGETFSMLGLLPLKTSFARSSRRLHLGYRHVKALLPTPFGKVGSDFRCHEFHYASTLEAEGDPCFRLEAADQASHIEAGLRQGSVFGSFYHIIAGG